MKYHPDKGGDKAKFIEINNAKDVLTDPTLKYCYDTTCFTGFGSKHSYSSYKGSSYSGSSSSNKNSGNKNSDYGSYSKSSSSGNKGSSDNKSSDYSSYSKSSSGGNKQGDYKWEYKASCSSWYEKKLMCSGFDDVHVSSIFNSLSNKFSTILGKLYALATIHHTNYFTIKDSHCNVVAEISGNPGKFSKAYLDNFENLFIHHEGCRKSSSNNYILESSKALLASSIASMKNKYDIYSEYKHHIHAFNSAGEKVAEIKGDPMQFHTEYLKNFDMLYFAHEIIL
ncbi:hypothetical protein NF27_HE00160 [Candidatus Jidaibacter acanthamoeba]|uniref:J domain-containing protein n=1 Tax=Candidatus Jidaibacter acanthamoebae TaxID=86105 RepID=A0A0C1MRG5_9RICK|nr:hypothetical protein NF27_HE00160 [Candidatus Jidaibacter acanthamoeba]